MIDFGYVLKRSETDYVVNGDLQGNGGYNVVPREIDPGNLYTLEEVRDYLFDNPDMLLDAQAINIERIAAESRERRDSLLQSVVDAMNPIRWELLSEEQKQVWREYRQALLDVPEQEGFPMDIQWPENPDGGSL
ncbi:MAG: phage tail assembly chaperone [Sphaerochaetaceae bacterium]